MNTAANSRNVSAKPTPAMGAGVFVPPGSATMPMFDLNIDFSKGLEGSVGAGAGVGGSSSSSAGAYQGQGADHQKFMQLAGLSMAQYDPYQYGGAAAASGTDDFMGFDTTGAASPVAPPGFEPKRGHMKSFDFGAAAAAAVKTEEDGKPATKEEK